MSAISDLISRRIESTIRQASRTAVDPRLRQITDPVVGKAIDTIRRGVFGGPVEKEFKPRLPFGGAAPPGDDFAGIHSRGDALQNWSWYALLPTVEAGGIVTDLPWYYAQTANLPMRSIQTDSAPMNGHPVHFPESYSVDQLQIGLFMDDTNKSQHWLKAWQSLVLGTGDPSLAQNQGMWGLPASYKKDINLAILSPRKDVAINVKYVNCWPILPSNPDLVSGSGEAMLQTVSFMVEDVYISLFNTVGPLAEFANSNSGINPVSSLSGFTGVSVVNTILNKFGLDVASFI